jgi:hypothetical protein
MAWNLIRRNNGETIHTDYVEWILDNAADISNGTEPGKSGSIGSLAYTARARSMWQKDAQGAWVKLGGGN